MNREPSSMCRNSKTLPDLQQISAANILDIELVSKDLELEPSSFSSGGTFQPATLAPSTSCQLSQSCPANIIISAERMNSDGDAQYPHDASRVNSNHHNNVTCFGLLEELTPIREVLWEVPFGTY